MSCKDFHELISAYIDDELSEKETRKLLHHLERCSACSEELGNLALQRARVASVIASYHTPIPKADFSRTVMYGISRLSLPSVSRARRLYENIVAELLLPIRKPAFALPLVFFLAVGSVIGFYLKNLPNYPKQQLLSVYELTTVQASTPDQAIKNTPVAGEVELHLFDHFARTSTETFPGRPSLLEYAAYTCTSNVADY